MVPRLFFPEAPHAVLVPYDTPPDPSTSSPSETKPDGAKTLHIIIGVVVFGIVASILACARHKFGNSTMRRKTKEGAKGTGRYLELGSLPMATLPPVPPAHGTPASPTRDEQAGYCREPPCPQPRRGIKEASLSRQTHRPVVVTNEEYFFGASPRRGPADRRHDGADPSRQGSPDKRTGRGLAGPSPSPKPQGPRPNPTVGILPATLRAKRRKSIAGREYIRRSITEQPLHGPSGVAAGEKRPPRYAPEPVELPAQAPALALDSEDTLGRLLPTRPPLKVRKSAKPPKLSTAAAGRAAGGPPALPPHAPRGQVPAQKPPTPTRDKEVEAKQGIETQRDQQPGLQVIVQEPRPPRGKEGKSPAAERRRPAGIEKPKPVVIEQRKRVQQESVQPAAYKPPACESVAESESVFSES